MSAMRWCAALVVLLLPLAAGAGLTAGDVDDHLNWDAYLRYLDRKSVDQDLPVLDLEDRISIQVLDPDGHPVAYAKVDVTGATGSVSRPAGSDGILRLFPHREGLTGDLTLRATAPGGQPGPTLHIDPAALDSSRSVQLVATPSAPGGKLDLLFVIDATGSMGDEMTYLTAELDGIIAQAVADHGNADLRLGLIVYRDVGDDYVVRDLGFTDSVATLRTRLSQQQAGGGGDFPEAMEQAVDSAVSAQWRTGAVTRMMVLIADAPPHVSGYGSFMTAVASAQRQGIHIYPLAASGVDPSAEYLMRSAAALTQGRYLFLTDDSGIGNSHAEPDIPCYQVTDLTDLLARVIDGEMTGHRIEASQQAIVRTVGHPSLGVCLADPDPQQELTAEEAESSGGGRAAGSAGAPEGSYSDSAASDSAAASGSGAPMMSGDSAGSVAHDAEASGDGSEGGASAADGGGEASDSAKSTPGPGLLLVGAALVAGVAWRRRKA